MNTRVKRLIEGFNPTNYKLTLNLDHDKLLFSGKVTIRGQKTSRPSQRITFHQKGLKISNAQIAKHDKKGDYNYQVTRINNHDSYNEVRLHADQTLFPGNYTVTMEFSGVITSAMQGIYPCYFESDGQKQHLVATQFESHHAREAFPCIDEPEAKATFDLTLITPGSMVALSNTPVKSQTSQDQQTTTFETTPRMSTYLLAFVVGNLHCVEATTKNGILMRTWGTAAQASQSLQFANDEAVRVIDFFEDYFATPFPLAKCDQVALPDFESGAMENWGLITYREIALLTNPDNRSLSSEQYVAMVIAHELSHQWFGNLVTMKWWDDLWLNESFASIMEHVALAKLHPEWEQWEQYTSSDVLSCSNRDIYPDVQSIRCDVRHPDEINTLFDPAIVYAKGGRLIKMLIDYIGEDDFREGLKLYFDKHAYSNTTRDDLWNALQTASNKDIAALMNPWIEQSGMPLLTVDHHDDKLSLSQERFLITDNGLVTDEQNHTWPIPLLASQELPINILGDTSADLTIAGEVPIFNQYGSGHYLVKYANTQDQARIINAVKERTVPSQSRINILNDMLLMARRGDISLTSILDLINQCGGEPRDAVWALICQTIGLSDMLTEGNDSTKAQINRLKVSLAQNPHSKLGWDDKPDDDPNTKHLRQTMLSLMIGGEDQQTIDKCIQLYNSAKNIEALPAEQRGLIIGAVVRHDPDVNIDQLINSYKQSPDPDIQTSISSALCSARNADHIDQIIEKALGADGFVRPQDIFRWYAYLIRNRYSREAAWRWLTTSWDRLLTVFGNSKNLDYFVVYSAGPLSTEAGHKQFGDFFDPMLDNISLSRNIRIAHTEILGRIVWRQREETAISKWATKYHGSDN